MKIAILGDTHFDTRSGSVQQSNAFHRYFKKFFHNIFFPYLETHNIKEILQLGDLFDNRKSVSTNSAVSSKEYFFDYIEENGYSLKLFVGNHDCSFKNTTRVNSPEILLREYSSVEVYSEPRHIDYDGLNVLLVPWICRDNEDECLEIIKNTNAEVMFGHLELSGFSMYRGIISQHGMEPNIFSKFDMVMTGHYHTRSSRGNIHYLGTPYELTWSDCDDPRGFHIFDTETRELTFIRNPYTMFNRLTYTDELVIDPKEYKGTYVKIFVESCENEYRLDQLKEELTKICNGVQIIRDKFIYQSDNEENQLEVSGTVEIMQRVVDDLGDDIPKDDVGQLLMDLYSEAIGKIL